MVRKKKIGLNIDMPQLVIIISIIFLTIGVCAGAAYAYILNQEEYVRITVNINAYLGGASESAQTDVFKEAVFKYGKNFVFLWFLGFIPFGAVVSVGILVARGAGLGFTSGILIKEFGVSGILYIARLYLLQNLLLIPAYLFMTYYSIAFSIKKRDKKTDILEYLLVFAVCAAAVVAAGLIETMCVI